MKKKKSGKLRHRLLFVFVSVFVEVVVADRAIMRSRRSKTGVIAVVIPMD